MPLMQTRYVRTLHQRIRELEDVNSKARVTIRTPFNPPSQLLNEANRPVGMPAEGADFSPCAGHSLPDETGQDPTSSSLEARVPLGHRRPAIHNHRDNG